MWAPTYRDFPSLVKGSSKFRLWTLTFRKMLELAMLLKRKRKEVFSSYEGRLTLNKK